MTEVPSHERRTALLVPVAVAEPLAAFRRRHLAGTVARGLPAHVTVLFPFATAAAFDGRLRAQVATHFAAFERFEGALARVGQFDEHVWLAPEPRDRFTALLRGTYDRFPEFPPYGNAVANAVPHLTIAEVGAGESIDQVAALAEHELSPGLPFGFIVDRVELFEELTDGTWRPSDSFELA